MESPTSPYLTSKFNYSSPTPQIRILDLHPSNTFSTQIECTISTVSLTNPPLYQALSYCWGDASIRAPILVNGTILQVTLNLEAALRRMRHQLQDGNRRLWIDAVCINQEDNDEKNYQVGLMRDIYLGADKIMVWLGEDGENARLALKFCEQLKADPKLFDDKYWDAIARGIEGDTKIPEENHDHMTEKRLLERSRQNTLLRSEDENTWKACNELLSSPWFSRSWIIQEVLHGREATAVIGDLQLPLDELCASLQTYIMLKGPRDALRIRRLYVSDTQFLSGEEMDLTNEDGTITDEKAIKTFERSNEFPVPTPPGLWDMWFRAYRTEFSIANIISEQRAAYRNEPAKTRPRIIELMLDFRTQGATDARDKIWAFWSMAKPEYPMSPDYKNDTKASVYVKIARQYVQRSLAVLQLTECPDRSIVPGKNIGAKEEEVLPSWVPDWSKSQTLVARGMFAHLSLFRAAEGFPGLNEGEVEPRFSSDEVPEILTTRGIYVAVVTATFRAHTTRDSTLGDDDAVTLFQYERDPAKRHGPFETSDWPQEDDSVSFMNTSWGPYHTEVGDVIIVVPGSNLPFLFRRYEERYLFVGACWLVRGRIQDVNHLKDDPGFDEVMFGSVGREEGAERRVEVFQLC